MDAAVEIGRNPVVSTRFSLLSMEMSRLTRDGTAETVSRNQILRRELSVISRVGDFCVLRFYICIYRYGSSLIVYSTLRRILVAVSHTISFTCGTLY